MLCHRLQSQITLKCNKHDLWSEIIIMVPVYCAILFDHCIICIAPQLTQRPDPVMSHIYSKLFTVYIICYMRSPNYLYVKQVYNTRNMICSDNFKVFDERKIDIQTFFDDPCHHLWNVPPRLLYDVKLAPTFNSLGLDWKSRTKFLTTHASLPRNYQIQTMKWVEMGGIHVTMICPNHNYEKTWVITCNLRIYH